MIEPRRIPDDIDPAVFVRQAIRSDFVSFVRRCFRELVPGTEFVPNWHIEAMAHHLERVRRGDDRRLIITLPPRSLKSITASVAFPAFIHGHDPEKPIICVSYSQDLAAKHQNDYRTIVRSPWYRQAFPDTLIDPMKDNEGETLLTRRGVRLATSVGGTLTGRGADVIIVDDPLKASDAASETKRKATNDWFSSTLLSRMNDKRTGSIVIVTQRLHTDDLVGHVLEADPGAWEVLNLPSIAPADAQVEIGPNRFHQVRQGDVLHPSREPLETLEELRRSIGSEMFAAQYLQEPVPPGGNMFKRSWVERYDIAPTDGQIIQSWDTASKTAPDNDWSVCTTWRVLDGRYYLLHVFREKLEYPDLRRKAVELSRRFEPRIVLVEDSGMGTALATELRAHGVRTKATAVSHSKEQRASIEAAKLEGGLVVLPNRAHWLAAFEAELFAFPGGRHDDQVDSMVQALSYDLQIGRYGAAPIRGCF